jgi:acetolactate synthase-1/2/3 large subunit
MLKLWCTFTTAIDKIFYRKPPCHAMPSCLSSHLETRPIASTGAAALLDTLAACGVDTVFGYPGGAVLPLYDALQREPRLRHVLVRHEQAAVHAAEAYARSTGRIGVVFVTSGPGVANTISGLLDAFSDSIPVLCISGQVATGSIGTSAFQECDALGISRTVTKWNVQLRSADEVAITVRKALHIACTGRPGPVLVDFPKDVQAACVTGHRDDGPPEPAAGPPSPPMQTGVPSDLVDKAAQLIREARRPVFYGGGGLVSSGEPACAAFAALVRRANAPCTLTLMGLGAFPASSPQWLGMLGMHGTLEANLAMHGADLVVCVGARFDDRVTGKVSEFCPDARIIHIDIDAAAIGKVVAADVGLVGDCGLILQRLLHRLDTTQPDPGATAAWWERIELWRRERCLDFTDKPGVIVPQRLMSALAMQLRGRSPIVSTDVGQHQMWAAQYLAFDSPRHWLTFGRGRDDGLWAAGCHRRPDSPS